MKYLLDTNVISELRKDNQNKADKNVIAWVRSVKKSDLYISVITIHETELGALRAERKDPKQGEILRNWVNCQISSAFAGRIMPVNTKIAKCSAALNVPNLRSFMDSLIAATALVHKMILVTRNVVDFNGTGVQLINPWQSPDIFIV